MKYDSLLALATVVLAAGEAAATYDNATQYTTITTTSYETYCPGPTTVTIGGSTYTVTDATTLTITDCPCTLTEVSGRPFFLLLLQLL